MMSVKTIGPSLSALLHNSASGIGVDIVHIPRITATLGRFGKRYLDRAFHAREQLALLERLKKVHAPSSICDWLVTPPSTGTSVAQPRRLSDADRTWLSTALGGRAAMSFLASRWAAKEALHKALRTERLLFTEILVTNDGEREREGEGGEPVDAITSAGIATATRHVTQGSGTGGCSESIAEAAAESRESLRRSIRAPSFLFSGEAQKALAARNLLLLSSRAINPIRLSLSHDGDYAIAFVALTDGEPQKHKG
jgi:phosphopantetheinyl transferase (holo-ACP synthase)